MSLAFERLQFAIVHARSVNFVQEELPALIALAEWHRQNKEYDDARELLEQIWAPADKGPYPLWEADARNTLAQVERDAHSTEAAIEAATAAYRLAWCDGPPYGYQYGLTKAQSHLQELRTPEPQLPPFDERKIARFPRWPNLKHQISNYCD